MKCAQIWLLTLFPILLGAQSTDEDRYRPLPTEFFQNTVYENPDYSLSLGGVVFDPLENAPGLEPDWNGIDDGKPSLHLIQFYRPLSKDDLSRVAERGLRVVNALRPLTLIVWGKASNLPAGDAWSSVRWSGTFEPGFKVLPPLRHLEDTVAVEMLVVRYSQDLKTLEAELKSLGGENIKSRPISGRFVVVTGDLPGSALIGAAHLPAVYSIQRQWHPHTRGELSNQLIAANFDAMNMAVTGYLSWLGTLGFNGAGLIMACVDSGVAENHPDLAGQFVTCTGPGCAGGASSGHGTHVAGIMGATGVTGILDPNGFLRAVGVAPGAKMIEQNFLNLALDPGGILALIEESFANSAVLSNNSWGLSPTAQGYDIPAMEVDMGVRDADPATAGNQSFNYILAVENGDGGVSSIGSPDEAKNAFTVGAHQAQQANTSQVAEFNNLAAVTGHGPALDGRNVPLMVAPGCRVESAEPETVYQLRCGTSMAAPHVAGSVALFINYYRDLTANSGGTPADPSPALVKAAFLPVAVDLEGFLDADGLVLGHRFDAKQGWGRLTLPPVLLPEDPVLYFDNPRIANNTGEIWRRRLQVSDTSKPVKIMLAWTDAPGHGLGGPTPALNNDLDLEVVYSGQTYRGNVFGASGWSSPGGLADALHNTEGVLLGPAATGTFEISVKGTDINSDGVPMSGSLTDQDFALVCYNCEEVADFSLNASPDAREVCVPQTATYELDLQSFSGFSSPVTLSVSNLPAGLSAQFSQNPVTPSGTSTLTLNDTANLARGAYEITVLATAGAVVRQIVLDLKVEPDLPGAGMPLMPADMATDQPLFMDFSWDTLATAETYRFELSDNPAFSNPIVDIMQEETTFMAEGSLAPATTFYWRVAGINLCGQGSYGPVRTFTTRAIPPILLVDDDNNSPDVSSFYTQRLDALGLSYDVFDTQNSTDESAEFNIYQTVLWVSGSVTDSISPKAGPLEATQDQLAAYLEQGGSLLISSQGYFNDLSQVSGEFNPFMADYLGLASGVRDAMNADVTGTGMVFNGIGPETLMPGFSNDNDSLNPSAMGQVAFMGDQGNAGLQMDGANFKTCYLAFSMAGMADAVAEETLYRWFNHVGLALPCRNQADLLMKLPVWDQDLDLTPLIYCVTAIGNP